MPTASHFKNFRLSSLGFSRVVALEDVMSGEEALSCEEDDIADGAALRSGKKLAGLAAKRAAAAGGDVAPRMSPLIVVRNVELRCVCLAGQQCVMFKSFSTALFAPRSTDTSRRSKSQPSRQCLSPPSTTSRRAARSERHL